MRALGLWGFGCRTTEPVPLVEPPNEPRDLERQILPGWFLGLLFQAAHVPTPALATRLSGLGLENCDQKSYSSSALYLWRELV